MLLALILLCAAQAAKAQSFAVSTNLMTWANLGTVNAEGSISVSRHFSIHTGLTANPWNISTPTEVAVKNNQYGAYVGARYWPWHVYSEWWIGTKLQYKNFSQAGLFTRNIAEGNAVGAGLSGGYTFILSRHFNLDLGVGFWGGGLMRKDESPEPFVFLDNMIVSFVYVF